MRLLRIDSAEQLQRAIDDQVRLDYLYSYPPRQAYRRFRPSDDVHELRRISLDQDTSYNLYLHFPFCRQICAFCNLYATAVRPSDSHKWYADWLLQEVVSAAPLLAKKKVRTVYFGGGTPSLIDVAILKDVLEGCADLLNFDLRQVPEIALEVTPFTASPDRLDKLRAAGFNRINLGVQTTQQSEIRTIGRKDEASIPLAAVRAATMTGFANVCVDLIYGLPGQNIDTWRDSVLQIVAAGPETICAYPLTLRPGTGFARRGYHEITCDSYEMYDVADSLLQSAGYVRETHVRWVLPGRGGYLQKQYHWACETLVGFGAGARSYLWNVDTRNGYSVVARRETLEAYGKALSERRSPIVDGIIISQDERLRKSIILGLGHIQRAQHAARFGSDPVAAFPREFSMLSDCRLVDISLETIQLTDLGIRHRDVAIQPFVSERVRALVEGHDYLQRN